MGVILKPDGKKEEVLPRDGKFSIYEISEILNGLIEPHFVGDYWVFINKTGFRKGMPYNEAASVLFNFPISGSCMIAKEAELPEQFFYPKQQPVKAAKGASSRNDDNSEITTLEKEMAEKDRIVEEKKKKVSDLFLKTYEYMFKRRKDPLTIFKRFIILDDDLKKLDITKDRDKQYIVLRNMLQYFKDCEEYEKCGPLTVLISHIENNI